jgi:hypothetical protein
LFYIPNNIFFNSRNFQSFDASQPTEAPYARGSLYPYLDPSEGAAGYHGDIFTPSAPYANQPGFGNDGISSDFEDEPPLLEG